MDYIVVLSVIKFYRVCSMTNSTVSDEILAKIRDTLRISGYNFSSENARIISGVEEAIGGWTTANYLDKNLNPPKEVSIRTYSIVWRNGMRDKTLYP